MSILDGPTGKRLGKDGKWYGPRRRRPAGDYKRMIRRLNGEDFAQPNAAEIGYQLGHEWAVDHGELADIQGLATDPARTLNGSSLFAWLESRYPRVWLLAHALADPDAPQFARAFLAQVREDWETVREYV